MQNARISVYPGKKCYQLHIHFSRLSLTSEFSVHEHIVTIVTIHYFAKNGIAKDNKLLQNVGKIWHNQKSNTWQTNVAGLVTVIRHRETSGERKKTCYTPSWLYKYINHHTEELSIFSFI